MDGKLIVINNTNMVSDKFKKREFVIEYAENPQYPEYIKMEFVQDKCDLLDSFKVGDMVSVEYNLKGRKWTNPEGEDVYFNTIQAWKISKADQAGDLTPERDKNEATAGNPDWINKGNDGTDDLPF